MASAADQYSLLQEIKIGGTGGWDYLSVDSAAHRLYVSHSTQIEVVDLEKGTVIGTIADTPGVHGFAIASGLKRGFSTNGNEARSSMVDLTTMKTIAKIETGNGPDATAYDESRKEVYTFNGRGQSATVISAATGTVVATIPLGDKPEAGVVDTKARRLYVNLEDTSNVAVIDTAKHELLAKWPLAPCQRPTGIAVDTETHRLFVACGNGLMAMMDSTNGKIVTTVPIGGRADGAKFDQKTKLAFASSGQGTVTIAHEDSPDKLTVVQTLETASGARTMTIDPVTHRIYLPVATMAPSSTTAAGAQALAGGPREGGPPGGSAPDAAGGPPAGGAGGPPGGGPPGGGGRGNIVPDSFRVLVFGTK
jgi:YVTN family beta-propeller protein